MHIAFYHSNLPMPGRKPGGVSVWVHRLAGALVDRGHRVTVHTFSDAPPDHVYEHRRIARGARFERRTGRLTLGAHALNRVEWGAADVVHLHGDDWFFGRRTLPTVRTMYGSALLEAATATSLKRRVTQAIIFAGERRGVALADAAYAIGPDSFSLYDVQGCLPCGVDPPASVVPTAERRPVVLFVGTWEGRKRGRLLWEAFTQGVRPHVPDAELWMVSDRCDEAPGVRWFQAPSDEELRSLYSQAAVFCLPSRYEGLGIPYLEAMAHGTPAVASPNPGAEHLLGGGQFGVIADDDRLASEITRLLESVEDRERLAAMGTDRAAEYTWERSAIAHERAYERAITVFEQRRGAG